MRSQFISASPLTLYKMWKFGPGLAARAIPDSMVRGANMGHIWGRQDPGGPHVGPMNLLSGMIGRTTMQEWGQFGPGLLL